MYFCYQSIVSCNITLTDEGNENGEKTTIGLISIKATLHVQHTFFVHFFAVVLHDYNVKNFQKVLSYTFFGGNVLSVLVLFHCRSFYVALVAASISHVVTAATKFLCCSSNTKKCLLCFFYLSL